MPGPGAQVDYRWSNPNQIYYGLWLDLQNGQAGDATPPGQGGSAVGHALSRILRITNNGTPLYEVDLNGVVQASSGTTLTNVRNPQTGAYALQASDAGKTIGLGGNNFYTLSAASAAGFIATFEALLVNEDATAGKLVALTGIPSFILWPLQSAWIYIDNGVWQVIRPTRWILTGPVTLNVDPVNGLDTNDGLATGTGRALQTLNGAHNLIQKNFDVATQAVTVQGVASGAFSPLTAFGGYVGDTGNVTYVGNPNLAITGATNATPIVMTVPGHQYNNGDHVIQSGVQGNTAANGAFKVASSNQGAGTYALTKEIDGSNVAGSGAYTANTGTVASPRKATIAAAGALQPAIQGLNGAAFNVQGFSVSSALGQCILADLATIKITGKMDYGASGTGLPQIYATRNAYIETDDAATLSGATYGFVQATHGAQFRNVAQYYLTANLNYNNPVDANNCFALASSLGQIVETANNGYNLNGFTLTCQAQFRMFEQGMIEASGQSPPAAGYYLGLATGNQVKFGNTTLGPSWYIDSSGNFHVVAGTGAAGFAVDKNDNSIILFNVNNGGLAQLMPGSGLTAGGVMGYSWGAAVMGIAFGSGAPTMAAAQGTLYLRSDGNSTNTRLYINTNGSTGWTAITTAT